MAARKSARTASRKPSSKASSPTTKSGRTSGRRAAGGGDSPARGRPRGALAGLLALAAAGLGALWGCGAGPALPEWVPRPAGERVAGALGDSTECLDEWRAGIPRLADVPTRLICRKEYVDVYDPARKVPRVVGEYLTPAEFSGDAARDDHFAPDPDLSADEAAQLSDYRRSGYDRGHMAPAADFKSSAEVMEQSFYLSNIVPQNHNMNAGVWAGLENAARDCARSEGGLFVLTGPVLGRSGKTIGAGVAVPQALFKVVVSGRRARAFIIENRKQPNASSFGRYEVTPREVERQTGLNLFPEADVALDEKGRFCAGSFGG